jgi:hypothetical protein
MKKRGIGRAWNECLNAEAGFYAAPPPLPLKQSHLLLWKMPGTWQFF